MQRLALAGLSIAVAGLAAAAPATSEVLATEKQPTAAVCVPKTIRLEYFSSLGAKLGEYDAPFGKLNRVYENDPYNHRCLWMTQAGGTTEAFVVFIATVPAGIPGRIASGDCARNRPDSPPFYHSRKRQLSVSGGNRLEFQRALGGNEKIIKGVLAAAEAAGVGLPCPGKSPPQPSPKPKPKPKPKPPPPLKRTGNLYIDYKMPDRFGLPGKNGLIAYHTEKSDIQPDGFRVNFTVKRTDKKECKGTLGLTVPRASAFGVTGRCEFYAIYREEGVYTVRVTLDNTGFLEAEELEGLLRFPVQDWLIVGLGDSNGSGEGAPDKEGGVFESARWQNKQCHRSALSYQGKTALAIEDAIEQTSVTFVHLACSGASILDGMLGDYEGIEEDAGDLLPPQIKEMKRLVGNREVDAVMISIGVNDLKFGKLVAHCIVWPNCPKRKFAAAKPVRPLEEEIADLLTRLPGRYKGMARTLRDADVLPARVYLSEYFDSTKDQNGETCDPLIGTRLVGFTQYEAQWAHDNVLLPLNASVARAVDKNNWNMIRGAYKRFERHGYCTKPPKDGWIVWLGESRYKQGNVEGTLHSSPTGNDAQAEYATNALRRAFYPNGRTRAPR